MHFPLPRPAAFSEAECAFDIVRRGLEAEGRADEFGLPTFPSRRFVSAGGLTVAHEGLCEYELVDIEVDRSGESVAKALAITLLRSTGMLSRLGMKYRPMPAGPLTPVEGLQLQGQPIVAKYALCLDCDNPYSMVDEVFLPLEVIYGSGNGQLQARGSALAIGGAEVSAVRRSSKGLEVRVFNPRSETTTVNLGGYSGRLVDLRGRDIEEVDKPFDLRPHGIATVLLTNY